MTHTPAPVNPPLVEDLALLSFEVTWTNTEPQTDEHLSWAVQAQTGPEGQTQCTGTLHLEGAWGSLRSTVAALVSVAATHTDAGSKRRTGTVLEEELASVLWAFTRQTVNPITCALPTGPPTGLPRQAPQSSSELPPSQ